MSYFGVPEELMNYLCKTTHRKSIFIGSLLTQPELREWDIAECSSKQAFVFNFSYISVNARWKWASIFFIDYEMKIVFCGFQYFEAIYSILLKDDTSITLSRCSHLKFIVFLFWEKSTKNTHLALYRFLSNQMQMKEQVENRVSRL